MNRPPGDWCERLARAVADGRYLEDPGLWREHVEGCASCRELVGGLHALQGRLDRAAARIREEAAAATDGEAMIAEAFRRYRAHRRVQGLTLGLVALVGLALGVAFFARGSSSPGPSDPTVYARQLHERVFGDGKPDYELLKRDATLREEYLVALEHESSLVRRTATRALMWSGVRLDTARLERALTTWDENLEQPLEVAARDTSSARYVEDALAAGREATLISLLSGAFVQASQGGPRVDPRILEPFVDDPAPAVRVCALNALGRDPTWRPDERIVRRLRVDEDAEVRKAAATVLVDRLGDPGVDVLLDSWRAKPDELVEATLLGRLGTGPAVLALSRERIADPAVPLRLALLHLRLLARAEGVGEPPRALLERALGDSHPTTWALLAQVAAEQDLVELRDALQERWRLCPVGIARTGLARSLVCWDCDCGVEERLHLALDILGTERDGASRERVESLTESSVPSVRERARDMLSDW